MTDNNQAMPTAQSQTPAEAVTEAKSTPKPRPELLALCVGLEKLTDKELSELDEVITPRVADLMAKAFGPEFLEILGPLYLADEATDAKGAKEATDKLASSHANANKASSSMNVKQLRSLIADPRYWRDRDPQFISNIEAGFQQLYPTR